MPVALRWWQALEANGYLSPRHQTMTSKQKEKELVEWAVTLDAVERLDNIPREEIISILKWLMKVDDFWLPRGALQSLSSIRRSRSGGSRKIDTIYAKYKAWANGRGKGIPRPQHNEKFTAFEVQKLREAYPELADKFKQFPIDEAGREYRFHDDQG